MAYIRTKNMVPTSTTMTETNDERRLFNLQTERYLYFGPHGKASGPGSFVLCAASREREHELFLASMCLLLIHLLSKLKMGLHTLKRFLSD